MVTVAVDGCKDVVELLTGVQVCDVTKEHLFVESFDSRIINEILRAVKRMEETTNRSQWTIAKVDRLWLKKLRLD